MTIKVNSKRSVLPLISVGYGTVGKMLLSKDCAIFYKVSRIWGDKTYVTATGRCPVKVVR